MSDLPEVIEAPGFHMTAINPIQTSPLHMCGMQTIPSKTQILVIGGGPSGSYAAAALSREGFHVTVLEAVKFPRYHIGESLLPSVQQFLEFIDVVDQVKAHGFCLKPGVAVKFNQHKREGYTDFLALDPNYQTWNVVRSEFDELLLRHAASSGVAVFEEVKVTSILFEDDNPTQRPLAAQYQCKPSLSFSDAAQTGTIHFDYLVDASGRTGIMSQKYLKSRRLTKSLDNVAVWGYWTGCGSYSPNTRRENAVFIEALRDETGWAWFIPLHDGTVSVGVVQDKSVSAAKKRALRERTGEATLKAHYLNELKHSPGTLVYIGDNGKLLEVRKDGRPGVTQATDASYSAGSYAGVGFRLVGDAAAFIDPFFSSGVHLALTGGLVAAATIASSIRGDASEDECAKWHDTKVGTAYTRFLLVVLGAYKQMRAQQTNVLSDVNEDNFDRAFSLLRPVIQGTADTDKRVTESEIQQTMDFVKHLFAPTDPEMHAAVQARLDPAFFGSNSQSPILLEADLNRMLDPADEDAKHVLAEVNARKPIHVMYDLTKDFGSPELSGWTVNMKRGELGIFVPTTTVPV